MKRGRKLILLCSALAVLVAGYLVLRPLTAQPEEGAGVVIASPDTSNIDMLSWTYSPEKEDSGSDDSSDPSGQSVELELSSDVWKYIPDDTFPVAQSSVENLLEQLAQITAGTTISSPSPLSEYGLDEPQVEISASTSAGETITLAIGDENSLTGECYLMVDGDASTLYTVSSTLKEAFSLGLYDVVEMEDLPEFGEPVALSITQPGDASLELEYVEDSSKLFYNSSYHRFVERDGNMLVISDTSAQALCSDITGLYWLGCVEHNAQGQALEEYGLAQPETLATLTYELEAEEGAEPEKAEFTIYIGSDCDEGTYAMMEGSNMVYIISTDSADSIRYTTYASLKSSTVCDMDWDSVESVAFTLEGENYEVTFSTVDKDTINDDGESETVTEDVYTWDGSELPQEDFESILDSITGLTAEGTASDEFGQEMLTIGFTLNSEAFPQMTLTIYSYSADNCAVSFNGDSGILVGRDLVTELIDGIQNVFQ